MTVPRNKMHPLEIAATLREVTVTYDGYQTRALHRVDADFRRGEVTAVLGAKGAGKSTLLKILAGRLRPTEGDAKVFGRSPRGGMKSRVGYMPSRADANAPAGFVDRWLGKRKPTASIASGIARMAQAILGNRELLVFDEPLADLNPAEQTEARALIADLIARGKTVVIASDSLMEIRDWCDRLVILHEGRVQAIGTLSELLTSSAAIRFLPAVLPGDIVERVLEKLREEILSGTTTASKPPARPPTNTAQIELSAPPGKKAPAPAYDSIDHQKLDDLTKPRLES